MSRWYKPSFERFIFYSIAIAFIFSIAFNACWYWLIIHQPVNIPGFIFVSMLLTVPFSFISGFILGTIMLACRLINSLTRKRDNIDRPTKREPFLPPKEDDLEEEEWDEEEEENEEDLLGLGTGIPP